ncbi:MAG: hypothetical protein UHS54_04580 [Lachnospiraceae bacterium]|nr:hypothetical protein [Lachnospiraceae bacterium]
MMCSAYFGELSEERKANWNHKEENPYSVLVSPISLERKGHRLLDVGNKYFHDRIQVDWGSFAWKCNPEEIIRFLNDNKTTLPWLIEDEEDVIEKVKTYISERGNVAYGVVFVEEA